MLCVFTILPLLLYVSAAISETSLPSIADAWIQSPAWARSAAGSPVAQNRGREPELVLNGRNDFALLQFDFTAVRGKEIRSARLRVHRQPAPVPLAMVGLSTISGSGPWNETDATFLANGARPWAYAGSDITDVTFSLGGSLYDYVQPRDAGGDWWEIDVPVPIVTALAVGDQFGLMLTDEKGQIRTRHSIGSRESVYPPSLVVETAPPQQPAPGPVAVRKIESTPETARALGRTTLRPGSVILRFGGARAARYELRYSRQPITAASFDAASVVARWMMDPLSAKPAPLARANSLADEVTAIVEDLAAGETYHFAARAIDAAGRAGPVTQLGSRRAYDRAFPELPPAPAVRQPVVRSAAPAVWAAPELVKIDPKTGELLEAAHYADHRSANPVWNAEDSTVRLRGARNEFVAFQLAVEGAPLDVAVAAPIFAECKLPPALQASGAIQLFREWFVPDDKNTGPDRPWYPDALIPWGTPTGSNGVPGQRVEVAFVDVYIPRDAAAGVHRGRLRVRDREIALQVEVLPVALPDDLGFVVDLNGYGGVNSGYNMQRGTPEYRRLLHSYHRLAHLNRGTLDILGYSHSGSVEPDQTPKLEGEGAATRVASWADFDAHFGPLVDGSAFADLPRARVPVTNIYLPFFENWPGNLRKNYKHNDYPVAQTVDEYRQIITRHALEAAPIEQSFPQEYQDRFSAVVRQFAEHFRERGWLRTKYFVYLNDKYYYKDPSQHPRPNGVSWWLLDEPNHRDDVRAISFFAWLTKRWLGDHKDVGIEFRTDISYIDFIRDLLAGQIDLDCTSGHFLSKNRYLMDHRDRFGRVYWNYASTNHPRETNTSMRAWCWRAWLGGADGIVPWNTIRGIEAWERAEPLTVFYVGRKFGADEPFPSLRLKAFRRGQQDIEYLLLLARKKGWDREAVTRAIGAAARLDVGIAQHSEEDAGAVTFRGASDKDFERLLARVAAALK